MLCVQLQQVLRSLCRSAGWRNPAGDVQFVEVLCVAVQSKLIIYFVSTPLLSSSVFFSVCIPAIVFCLSLDSISNPEHLTLMLCLQVLAREPHGFLQNQWINRRVESCAFA